MVSRWIAFLFLVVASGHIGAEPLAADEPYRKRLDAKSPLSEVTTTKQQGATPSLRYPVSLVVTGDRRRLLVANRNGTISRINMESRQYIDELLVGEQLAWIASVTETIYLVADESAAQVILLHEEEKGLRVLSRITTPGAPVHIEVISAETEPEREAGVTGVDPAKSEVNPANGEGEFSSNDVADIYVSCLWARQVARFQWVRAGVVPGDISESDGASESHGVVKSRGVLDLPFSPRAMVIAGDRLIVADGFGPMLGIVNRNTWDLEHVRKFPGHNLRGMVITPDDKLVVGHQMLNELAHSVRTDVHWGLMMSNDLRWLPVSDAVDPEADLYQHSRTHPLGDAGDGTADPSGVAFASGGRVAVSLGGVGQVAIGSEEDFGLRRVEVGKRPTAITFAPDERYVVVANTFEDSVSFVDTEELVEVDRVSLGPMRKLTLSEVGEQLFYDASLSHDRWMSCHSCHPDGHTNQLRNDNFSDKSFGAPKRVLSLLGNRHTAPYAWSGKTAALDDQIRNSISVTMQRADPPSDLEVEALRNFLWGLMPPPSVNEARGRLDEAQIAAGKRLFASQGCVDCHQEPYYTSGAAYDVGFEDEQGNREFNPPSLLGVSQRGPYFHDNRASTLDDVINQVEHQLSAPLSDRDAQALLAFLRSL